MLGGSGRPLAKPVAQLRRAAWGSIVGPGAFARGRPDPPASAVSYPGGERFAAPALKSGMPEDALYKVAYDEAVRAMSEQEAVIDSWRTAES